MKYRYSLPEYGSFEPFIDEATRRAHLAYLKQCMTGLNIALDAYDPLKRLDAAELSELSPRLPSLIAGDVAFYAPAVAAHLRYFASLGGGGETPTGALRAAICASFGSFESFVYHFRTAAEGARECGFLYLIRRPERRGGDSLALTFCPSHGAPPAGRIILALDLWEHAYFGIYGLDRAKYADSYLKQVRWADISSEFAQM